MRYVKGKRRFEQESMWGFLHVREVRAGVQAFYVVLGKRAWGFQWTLTKKR